MSNQLYQSVKDRIKQIAKTKEKVPAELWQILVLERLLVRITNSKYKAKFIFKGGMLLSKYFDLDRETVDLDLLVRELENQRDIVQGVFEEIAKQSVEDGFCFKDVKVTELNHPRMRYHGIRVFMNGLFIKTRFKVQIDLGFGDIVTPITKKIELMKDRKGPLFESHIEIASYPKEFIFAEKLETVIDKGYLNSRMKDFHDLYSLIFKGNLDCKALKRILDLVFRHRQTQLTYPILPQLDKMKDLQGLWGVYQSNQKVKGYLPVSIDEIVDELNKWLKTHL